MPVLRSFKKLPLVEGVHELYYLKKSRKHINHVTLYNSGKSQKKEYFIIVSICFYAYGESRAWQKFTTSPKKKTHWEEQTL